PEASAGFSLGLGLLLAHALEGLRIGLLIHELAALVVALGPIAGERALHLAARLHCTDAAVFARRLVLGHLSPPGFAMNHVGKLPQSRPNGNWEQVSGCQSGVAGGDVRSVHQVGGALRPVFRDGSLEVATAGPTGFGFDRLVAEERI